MAKTTETDLVAAMDKAQLSHADWAEMVQDCRGCDWVHGCQRWLGQQKENAVPEVPETCVNQGRFMALKSALEALEK